MPSIPLGAHTLSQIAALNPGWLTVCISKTVLEFFSFPNFFFKFPLIFTFSGEISKKSQIWSYYRVFGTFFEETYLTLRIQIIYLQQNSPWLKMGVGGGKEEDGDRQWWSQRWEDRTNCQRPFMVHARRWETKAQLYPGQTTWHK